MQIIHDALGVSALLAAPFTAAAIFASHPPTPTAKPATGLEAMVISVHDGDTIAVVVDTRRVSVRLAGVDAPELKQGVWGDRARMMLDRDVNHKVVTLFTPVPNHAIDVYGRMLAYVFVGDRFENLELVKAGCVYARNFGSRFPRFDELKTAEGLASAAKVGFWPTPPVDPAIYRKEVKATARAKASPDVR